MDFGDCIKQLKQGKKMARRGWNGKGMYIYLTAGREIPTDFWQERLPSQNATEREIDNGVVQILPHIDMKAADGMRVIGWLASQSDMLSDDWEVVL